ncbi:MAG TPA: hypothetical protein VEL74_02485, partial [Thermoanaerobaculia bacterium]|nr:hypothetical protein [Thermoanaerobaculia bacterium]
SQGNPPHAASALVLRYALAAEASLTSIVAPEQGFVTVRFFRGEQLVHEDAGTLVGLDGSGFMRVRHVAKVATTRAEIVARHRWWKVEERESRLPHLLRACFLFQADLDAHAQQEATHAAWSDFWSDLLGAGGAATGGQLLEPAQRYTLEARVRWRHRDPSTGDETAPSASKVTLFPFVTEDAEAALARRLRPRTRDFLAAGDNWDVETVPFDGEEAVYTERPLHLTFRDGRFDAYYARFGRRVVLRIVNERGEDLFDRLEYLATHATELPEYQQTWYRFVTEGCAPEGASVLWQAGFARFTTLLETNHRYEAALVPVEDTAGAPFDPETVDWNDHTPLHTFRFRTSRWPNLTAHVAAHEVLDEVASTAGVSDLAALYTALGSPGPERRFDDQALDEALAALGLPPRPPAAVPEVVRVWRATEDGHEIFAVLVDGPEPLVRDAASHFFLRDEASGPQPIFMLGSRSGSRLLLFFHSGVGFDATTASALQLEVIHPFVGLNGQPATEQATLAIPVPARPPFFDEEAP